jgi:tRNA(Ile)-lysidine synthase
LLSHPAAKRFQAKWNPVRVKETRQNQNALDPAWLFAGFETLSGLLLAVSGGPDSAALMRLAAHWRHRAGVQLAVATVDHGLRADSQVEARTVGEWAAALGLPHAVLYWRGEKPVRAIQEKARDARYALLFAHARALGAEAVATAHHADDQWETIVFRLARGSGVGGLAGMARDQIFPDGRLIRPLLGLPKQALVDYCRAQGQGFFEDPANGDQAYARARLRALGGPLRELGFDRDKAARLAQRARKAEEALDWAAKEMIRRTISPEKDVYHLGDTGIAPLAVLERFLSLAIVQAVGAPPRRLDRLETLADNMSKALINKESLRATLGGCALVLNQRGCLALRREPPRTRGLERRP